MWKERAANEPLKESERLCRKGAAMLQQMGWPPDAMEELVTTLMGAGMAYQIEQQIDEASRNEALIQKAGAN